MPEIRKRILFNKREYFIAHLEVLNCILPIKMTPKEIEVVAAFMSLEGSIVQYRFGASARKIIMQQLKISPSGLTNYILSLLGKNLFKEVDNTISIQPILFPDNTEQIYQLKFVNADSITLTPTINAEAAS